MTRFKAAFSVLAAVVVLTLTAQTAAAAEYTTSPPPSGGGSTGVGGPPPGGGGGGGGAVVACYAPDGTGRATTTGVATAADPILYDWYPGCFGYRWTGDWEECPTSFEVWRFYGTNANPTLSMTVSKVNSAPGSCNSFPAFIAENHPDDAYGGVIASPVPWRSSGLLSGANGVPYNYSQLRSLTPVYTTTPAFNMAGRFCSDYERPNTELAGYFDAASTAFYEAAADSVRRSYFDTLGKLVAETPAQPGYADVRMDLARIGASVKIGDQYHCASPRDFTSVIAAGEDPLRAPQRNISGYCYAPTVANKERFASPTGGSSVWVPRNANASYTAPYQVGIEKYVVPALTEANRSSGNWGNQPNGIGTNSGVPVDVASRVSAYYRNALEAELSGRPWTLGLGEQTFKRAYTPGYGMIGHYAQPATPPGGSWTVALGAQCAMSYGDYVTPNTGGTTTDPLASVDAVEYVVNNPTVAQSGGMIRDPYQISGTPGSIMCGDSACPTAPAGQVPELLSVSADVKLVAPAGKTLDKDYAYTSRPSYNGNRFAAAVTFYTPTDQSSKYSVAVTGTAQVAYYQPKTTSVVVCGDYSSGEGCRTITNTTNERVVREVPLRVRYASGTSSFAVISSLVTPTPGRQ